MKYVLLISSLVLVACGQNLTEKSDKRLADAKFSTIDHSAELVDEKPMASVGCAFKDLARISFVCDKELTAQEQLVRGQIIVSYLANAQQASGQKHEPKYELSIASLGLKIVLVDQWLKMNNFALSFAISNLELMAVDPIDIDKLSWNYLTAATQCLRRENLADVPATELNKDAQEQTNCGDLDMLSKAFLKIISQAKNNGGDALGKATAVARAIVGEKL